LNEGKIFYPCQDSQPNRESIEEQGFMECFGLLEMKLKPDEG
jgi:hypothetical protein